MIDNFWRLIEISTNAVDLSANGDAHSAAPWRTSTRYSAAAGEMNPAVLDIGAQIADGN